ncbi:uncharacterized protein LOC117932433 [Vitis riparia]|uniref:uncharacterized protein LOC117932433 n=1 Tax=Vitis riparia TaxID=96939 RepID=UPI00155B197D|nr:uncharacterized protein LOC117932433 [Vitis riparia]
MSSLFPKLTSLTLFGLDKLKGFYRGTRIARGPHLKKLIMLKWDQVGTLFQEIDSKGYIDSPIQQSFFLLEKDAFLNLEQLILMGSKMKIYLVTSSMAKTLVQLKVLTIKKCESVEEIVRHEGGEEPYDIVFSKLQRLRLVNLQSLKWFCSTTCIFKFPSLEQFEVEGCPQMEYFCETVPSTPRVKEVKIDDHVEEHFLGCDINTIIHNIALEKVCEISFF